MADKKYYDENGKEIGVGPVPASQVQKSDKQYFDINASPIQLNPSGVRQPFGAESYVPQTSADYEKEVAPYLGRFAVNTLPFAASEFGPAGTIGGNLLKQGMQHLAPGLFGEAPEDPVSNVAGDLFWGNAVPAAAGGVVSAVREPAKVISQTVLRKFPAVREKVVQELSRRAQQQFYRADPNTLSSAQVVPGSPYLEAAAGNPAIQEMRDLISGVQSGGTEFNKLSNKIMSDVQNVRNLKLATANGSEIATRVALNKLLDTGAIASEGKLDAKKILDELGGAGKEIYREAIPDYTMKNFKAVMNEILAQEKSSVPDRMMQYASGRLAVAAPAALTGAIIGGGTGHALSLAAGSLYLTNKALARLMENPNTANLVIQSLRTAPNTPKANLLWHAFQGVTGPEDWVRVGTKAVADVATTPNK